MTEFTVDQEVKVVKEHDGIPEENWVGAIGTVVRIESGGCVLRITKGHVHPEQNYEAWFWNSELEAVSESH